MKLNNIKTEINNALNAIPEDEIDRDLYASKINEYSNECGCSMGAVFLFGAIVIFICLFFINTGWRNGHLFKYIWQRLLFIFLSATVGKIFGIGIARIKLVMLYYSLTKKQKRYVNMYKMD